MINEAEFKMGRSCQNKALFLRSGMPRNDQDSFAHWMQQEAGKFRAAARLLFPSATAIVEKDKERAMSATIAYLASGHSVVDAILTTNSAQAHIDVIEVEGSVMRLYSFIPKVVDLDRHGFGLEFQGQSGWLRREWREHLELVAFRVTVAKQLYPQHRIVPLIVVPVRGEKCTLEGLHDCFTASHGSWELNRPAAQPAVTSLLRTIVVARECEPLVPSVEVKIARMNAFFRNPTDQEIGYRCKKCEFRVPGQKSGFDRCWGPLAEVQPSMFDLTYMYFVQDENGKPVADRLAREGRVSMWDIPRDRIVGDQAQRQLMQLEATKTGREIIMREMTGALAKVEYPLTCLDIETLRSWLPAHRGKQVNDLILFQFSVHTRAAPTSPLEHTGWLNVERCNPNVRFLSALRAALGDTGTVCVWTKYEEVSFAELITELIVTGDAGDDVEWLRGLLSSGRVLDLHDICFRFHMHPRMQNGRSSIKAVLPAVWSVNSPIKMRAPYAEFPADIDPYAFLKKEAKISDGCMAMEGYLDVIGTDECRSRIGVESLARYCWVDTLAMFFVFDYWTWRLAEGSGADPSENTIVKRAG